MRERCFDSQRSFGRAAPEGADRQTPSTSNGRLCSGGVPGKTPAAFAPDTEQVESAADGIVALQAKRQELKAKVSNVTEAIAAFGHSPAS